MALKGHYIAGHRQCAQLASAPFAGSLAPVSASAHFKIMSPLLEIVDSSISCIAENSWRRGEIAWRFSDSGHHHENYLLPANRRAGGISQKSARQRNMRPAVTHLLDKLYRARYRQRPCATIRVVLRFMRAARVSPAAGINRARRAGQSTASNFIYI